MSDDKNPEQQPGANPDEPADDTTTAGESAANESTASDSTASTRRIVETPIDLSGVAAATEKIRAARGQTSRVRPREEPVDLSGVRDSAPAAATGISGGPARHRSSRQSVSLAVTLWLIAAIIGGIAAVLAWHPGVSGAENRAFVNSGETSEVVSQLSDKACRPFTYDWQKLQESVKRASESLTGTAKTDFEKTSETNRKIIVQAKADSDCHVDTVGVSSLTEDRAVLIATLIISVNSDGQAVENVTPRLQYTMVKENGDWLISEVGDVE